MTQDEQSELKKPACWLAGVRLPYRIVLAILLVGVISGIGWQFLHQREPVYQGKSLRKWLEGYMTDPNHYRPAAEQLQQRQEADRAVRQLGTNAIPSLLRMLRTTDTYLKRRLLRVASKQRFIQISYTSAAEQNMRASMAFGSLKENASNAVPALVQIYNENRSEYSQNAAINALRSVGSAAAEAIPCLLGAAVSSNFSIRHNAVAALGEIHAQPELAVPVLIKALRDPDANVRRAAACSLKDFGADAKKSVPALLELLKDKDEYASSLAAEALQRIDPEAAAKAGATLKPSWE